MINVAKAIIKDNASYTLMLITSLSWGKTEYTGLSRISSVSEKKKNFDVLISSKIILKIDNKRIFYKKERVRVTAM